MQRLPTRIAVPVRAAASQRRFNSTLSNLTEGLKDRPSKIQEYQQVFQRGGVGMGAENPTFLKGDSDKAFLMAGAGVFAVGMLYVGTGLFQFLTGKGKKTVA